MRGEMLRHQRDVQRDQELEFGTPHPQSMQGMPSGLVTATQSGRPPSLQQQKVGEAIRDAEVTLRLLERAVNRAAPTAPTSRQSISRPASASSLHRGGSHARRPASANASMPGQRLAAARAYATGGDDRTRMATMHERRMRDEQIPAELMSGIPLVLMRAGEGEDDVHTRQPGMAALHRPRAATLGGFVPGVGSHSAGGGLGPGRHGHGHGHGRPSPGGGHGGGHGGKPKP